MEPRSSSGLAAASKAMLVGFTNVWSTYSEKRLKETFRISRSTLMFLLSRIRNAIEKDTITEEPISLEARLTICSYRVARGDYYFTIAEMESGQSDTLSTEVTTAILECLWEDTVKNTCRNQKKSLRAKS